MFAEANAGHVNCWNVANAGIFAVNCLVIGLGAIEQLPGEGSPANTLINKHPTLITAGEEVLRIYPVMLGYQAVFVLFQLTPWFRNNPLVVLITPWWVATNLLQIQWVVELSRGDPGSIAYAMICCFGMLACVLGMILVIDARKPTFWEFWLLRGPFSVQAGWLIYATVVNVNVWAAAVEEPAFTTSTLLAIAMVSLSWIFILTALFGLNTRRPDPLLCAPVAWAMFWVWRSNEAKPDLPAQMINSMDIAAAQVYSGICVIMGMAVLIRLSMVCVANKLPQAYEAGGLEQVGKSMIDVEV